MYQITAIYTLRPPQPSHRIGSEKELYVTLTCPNCGNDRNFLVKTLQMHVVNVEGGRVEVSEESRPAVLEVLCDECESALNFEEFEDTLRKEVLLTIGARSEEHTSELQSPYDLVCRLLLEKKNTTGSYVRQWTRPVYTASSDWFAKSRTPDSLPPPSTSE